MATDFTRAGSLIKVTDGTTQPQMFTATSAQYSFNAAGNILNLKLGGTYFSAVLTDLRVAGSVSAPASTAAAYTALNGLFP